MFFWCCAAVILLYTGLYHDSIDGGYECRRGVRMGSQRQECERREDRMSTNMAKAERYRADLLKTIEALGSDDKSLALLCKLSAYCLEERTRPRAPLRRHRLFLVRD